MSTFFIPDTPVTAATMVGDCAVLLIQGNVHPVVYHVPDEYHYSAIRENKEAIFFGEGESIASIVSSDMWLLAITNTGLVYKMKYAKGTGKFSEPKLMDFGKPIQAVGIWKNAALGFAAEDLADPKAKSIAVEVELNKTSTGTDVPTVVLPKLRTSAMFAGGGNDCFPILGFDKDNKALVYGIPAGASFTQLRKFRNGVVTGIGANQNNIFVCLNNGKFAYSTNLKIWSEFELADAKLSKISVGDSQVLGATTCGSIVVLKPQGSNVMDYETVAFSNPLSEVLEVLHLASHEDACALAVVKVKAN